MCVIDGCEKPVSGRGWCKMHWTRWKRHGDPLVVKPFRRPMRPAFDRIMAKTDKNGPIPAQAPHLGSCWICTLNPDKRGYAYVGMGGKHGKNRVAMQVVYEELVGPIPDGLELDHLCMVTSCVNPDHLEPVTHAENLRRAAAAGRFANSQKTRCPQGHAYDEANTKWTKDGRRDCRECSRQRSLDWYYRNSNPSKRYGRKR